MLSPNISQALKIILERTKDHHINWALTGSACHALQGMDKSVHDIDILTDKEGAFEFERLFNDFVLKKVTHVAKDPLKSYHGILKINGIEVEILGEEIGIGPESDQRKQYSRLSTKNFVDFESFRVPLISLEQEYVVYKKMGRDEKAEEIRQYLEEIV